MRIYLSLIMANLLFVGPALFAQEKLENFVAAALSNNLVLKERKIGLDKSLLSLKEARSMFLPVSYFDGQYTLAQGGRSIDIPVGDLLNPVYKTLNDLTSTNNFPMVKNVSEQLNPNNFYDLRIRTSMPIINPSIKSNNRIKEQEIRLQENEVAIYKRELVKEVKQAYFNVLMTGKEIEIYQNALVVVNQNLRVNQSLLSNGKGLPAYVSRAESEVKQVESQLQNAMNSQQNAVAYFNFLLNRPLTATVLHNDAVYEDVLSAAAWNKSVDVSGREELKSLSIARDINHLVLKLNRAYSTPRLNAFLDLAAQGFDFRVNNRSFFYLGGLQLQVPIFTGKRNVYRIEQTKFDGQSLELNSDQARQQLELASLVSRNNVVNAHNSYQSAIKQEEAARNYFKLIDRGYQEGVNTFIEFLDARNQLTRSQLQSNLNKYKVLATLADFERQTASYTFN